MALILRIPGVNFTDTTIPVIRNDSIANAGTLDIFDALEPSLSWPKQGDPSEGVDTWRSLIGSNLSSFSGSVGWSNGFTTNTTGDDFITLPDTFRPSGSAARCVIFWVKPGVQTEPAASTIPVFGWFKTGTGDSPYLCYIQNSDTMVFSQGQGGTQAISSHLLPTTLQQYAFALQPIGSGGAYVTKFFRNGAFVNSIQGTATSIALSGNASRMGYWAWTNRRFVGTFLRAVSDDLSVTTPEDLVALDYAAHLARLNV